MTRAAPAFTILAAAALMAVSPVARAADPAPATGPIPIELNKLEPLPAAANAPAGCRVYFVINNNEPETLSQLRLDLILFGTDGVIARRVALDLGPLPAKKTGVRLFDLTGQACEGIGRVLVNDVLACQSAAPGGAAAPAAAGGSAACLDRLAPTSRIPAVAFGK